MFFISGFRGDSVGFSRRLHVPDKMSPQRRRSLQRSPFWNRPVRPQSSSVDILGGPSLPESFPSLPPSFAVRVFLLINGF